MPRLLLPLSRLTSCSCGAATSIGHVELLAALFLTQVPQCRFNATSVVPCGRIVHSHGLASALNLQSAGRGW